MTSKRSIAQKVLLFSLYGLIVLMVFFSFKSLENRGITGYQECVDKICEEVNQEYCQKFRVINNCCLGAGGQINSRGSCSFS